MNIDAPETQRASLADRLRVLQGARAEARHEVQGHNGEQRSSDHERQVPQARQGALGWLRRTCQRRGGQLRAAGALDSKRAAHGRAWTTTALSVSAPNEATITTYAYCHR